RSRAGSRQDVSAPTKTWPAPPSTWPRVPVTTWWEKPSSWTAASRWRGAEAGRGSSRQRQRVQVVVLRPATGDLGRAHAVTQFSAAHQRPALFQPEEQGAAPGVATSRG